MKRFTTSLALFLGGMPLVFGKSAVLPAGDMTPSMGNDNPGPVNLHPLNLPGENMFASHRSHSSHSSHSSHYSHRSGSGGSYYSPPSSGSSSSLQYGNSTEKPAGVGQALRGKSSPSQRNTPQLSTGEKRKLQVMRVQIALSTLGLYKNSVDGTLNENTKEALKYFQTLKGLPATGLMTTDTLNALGIPAVK